MFSVSKIIQIHKEMNKIYILYSTKRDLFYIGKTRNIKARMIQHNSGESGFTSSGIPWQLLWIRTISDWEEAHYLERKLKNLSRIRKVKFMNKYPEGIIDQELLKKIEESF